MRILIQVVLITLSLLITNSAYAADIDSVQATSRCDRTIAFVQGESRSIWFYADGIDLFPNVEVSGKGVEVDVVQTRNAFVTDHDEDKFIGSTQLQFDVADDASPGNRDVTIHWLSEGIYGPFHFPIKVVKKAKITSVEAPVQHEPFSQISVTLKGTDLGGEASVYASTMWAGNVERPLGGGGDRLTYAPRIVTSIERHTNNTLEVDLQFRRLDGSSIELVQIPVILKLRANSGCHGLRWGSHQSKIKISSVPEDYPETNYVFDIDTSNECVEGSVCMVKVFLMHRQPAPEERPTSELLQPPGTELLPPPGSEFLPPPGLGTKIKPGPAPEPEQEPDEAMVADLYWTLLPVDAFENASLTTPYSDSEKNVAKIPLEDGFIQLRFKAKDYVGRPGSCQPFTAWVETWMHDETAERWPEHRMESFNVGCR